MEIAIDERQFKSAKPLSDLTQHRHLLRDNQQQLMVTFFITFVVFAMYILIVKFIADYRARQYEKNNSDTNDSIYIPLSEARKWAYV